MSDHVDGDVAPAAGEVLTTADAVALAQGFTEAGQPSVALLARTILAWAPVVRAAEAQTTWMDGQTGIETWPEGAALIDATTAAVRARDGWVPASGRGDTGKVGE